MPYGQPQQPGLNRRRMIMRQLQQAQTEPDTEPEQESRADIQGSPAGAAIGGILGGGIGYGAGKLKENLTEDPSMWDKMLGKEDRSAETGMLAGSLVGAPLGSIGADLYRQGKLPSFNQMFGGSDEETESGGEILLKGEQQRSSQIPTPDIKRLGSGRGKTSSNNAPEGRRKTSAFRQGYRETMNRAVSINQ